MKIYSSIQNKVWVFNHFVQNGKRYLSEKKDRLDYEFISLGNNRFAFILDNRIHLVHIRKENSLYHIHLDGEYFSVRVEDEQNRKLRYLTQHTKQASGEQVICAPIPGLITKVKVKEGDKINPGEGLVVLEAMKMENEIKSDSEGIVKKILVSQGMPVDKDQELILIVQEVV